MIGAAVTRSRAESAVDLIDRSFLELRRAPATALAAYAIGAAVFLLALLYFCADMATSAFAAGHVGESSLALALLYSCSKLGQTVFVAGLAQGAGAPIPMRWTASRLARAAVIQATLQPTSLLVLPLAALAVLPFPWVLAFYENITVLGDGRLPLRETVRLSARRARLWPSQNLVALLILLVFFGAVLINVAVALIALPYLARSLFGVESVFTRSGQGLFNTTTIAASLALTFFVTSPLVKAVYRRRCFEAGSIESGEDLKARWRQSLATGTRPVMGLAVMAILAAAAAAAQPVSAPLSESSTATARPVSSSSVSSRVSPDELDRAIRTVLRKRAYAWRLPRDTDSAAEPGWLATLWERISQWTGWVRDAIRRAINALGDWLRRFFGRSKPGIGSSQTGFAWVYWTQFLALFALAAGAWAAALLLVRRRRIRRSRQEASLLIAKPEPSERERDREELPEDEWRRKALDLLSRGDLREATRAFYLAILAFLAARGTITPTRSKSNRDYEREIARRQRARPPVRELFAQCVATFEPIWYGGHTATPPAVELLDRNLERLKEQLRS